MLASPPVPLSRPRADVADTVARALARVRMTAADFDWHSLDVRADHALGGDRCPLDRRLVVTADIDEYKRWIGPSDADVRSGACAATPQRPRWARPPKRLLATDDLAATDRREVRRAAAAYVWGDSARMQAWRDVIAQHAAPFELDVVAAESIALRGGAVLRIAGRATMLLVGRLVLDDGQVQMTTDGYIAAGAIDKLRDFGGAHA